MYTNDLTQIRAGLVNYIGSMVKATGMEERAAKQQVVAILTEEALKITQDNEGIIDLYAAKPVLRGNVLVLKQRAAELSKLPKTQQTEDAIKIYKDIISAMEQILVVI